MRPIKVGVQLEGFEPATYAEDQPEYLPLPTIRNHTGQVISRWELTEEERVAVLEGADIFLTMYTFNHPLQPVQITVGSSVACIEGGGEDRGELPRDRGGLPKGYKGEGDTSGGDSKR